MELGSQMLPKVLVGALIALFAPAAAAIANPGKITEYAIPVESDPSALALGPEGEIWFIDTGNPPAGGPSVGRIDTSGAFGAVVPFPDPGPGQAIALGPDGNMWAAQAGHLDKVPPGVSSPAQITAYEYPAHSGASGNGSIVTGPDGRLWVGLSEELLASTPGGEMHLYETGAPMGISAVISGPGGDLWFSAGNQIRRITTSGGHTEADVFELPGTGTGVHGLAVGPDGNVWFTLAPAAVGRITPAGAITIFQTPAPLSLPFGIAAGPDGRMWFTEDDADSIGSIPLSATSGSEISEYHLSHPNTELTGIVAGPDERMWFAEPNANRLGAITTGASPPEPAVPPPAAVSRAPLPHNPLAVACSAETLSLLDVLARGGKAHLTGVAPRAAAGSQVKILADWNGKVIGRAKVGASGSFTATVAAPPVRFRHAPKGSYYVQRGRSRSARIRFTRRIYTSSITASGRTIDYTGFATPPLEKPPVAVEIRAASSCAAVAKGVFVAKVMPTRGGDFSAKITLPAALEAGVSVYLRAETVLRAGKRTLAVAAPVRGISLGP